jgi:hypothetical protein
MRPYLAPDAVWSVEPWLNRFLLGEVREKMRRKAAARAPRRAPIAPRALGLLHRGGLPR